MKKRVLIIDDDPDITNIAVVALERIANWATNTAISGYKGLEVAQSQPLDLILLDISMPGMDGLEVFAQLQANPLTAKIPVILLTAKVLPSEQRNFLQIGVAGIILKPFNPITLGSQIAEILAGS